MKFFSATVNHFKRGKNLNAKIILMAFVIDRCKRWARQPSFKLIKKSNFASKFTNSALCQIHNIFCKHTKYLFLKIWMCKIFNVRTQSHSCYLFFYKFFRPSLISKMTAIFGIVTTFKKMLEVLWSELEYLIIKSLHLDQNNRFKYKPSDYVLYLIKQTFNSSRNVFMMQCKFIFHISSIYIFLNRTSLIAIYNHTSKDFTTTKTQSWWTHI